MINGFILYEQTIINKRSFNGCKMMEWKELYINGDNKKGNIWRKKHVSSVFLHSSGKKLKSNGTHIKLVFLFIFSSNQTREALDVSSISFSLTSLLPTSLQTNIPWTIMLCKEKLMTYSLVKNIFSCSKIYINLNC